MRKRIPNACLLLIGDANQAADRRWLEQRAIELNVSDALVWTGWVDPMVAWDIYALPTWPVSLVPRGELFDWHHDEGRRVSGQVCQ